MPDIIYAESEENLSLPLVGDKDCLSGNKERQSVSLLDVFNRTDEEKMGTCLSLSDEDKLSAVYQQNNQGIFSVKENKSETDLFVNNDLSSKDNNLALDLVPENPSETNETSSEHQSQASDSFSINPSEETNLSSSLCCDATELSSDNEIPPGDSSSDSSSPSTSNSTTDPVSSIIPMQGEDSSSTNITQDSNDSSIFSSTNQSSCVTFSNHELFINRNITDNIKDEIKSPTNEDFQSSDSTKQSLVNQESQIRLFSTPNTNLNLSNPKPEPLPVELLSIESVSDISIQPTSMLFSQPKSNESDQQSQRNDNSEISVSVLSTDTISDITNESDLSVQLLNDDFKQSQSELSFQYTNVSSGQLLKNPESVKSAEALGSLQTREDDQTNNKTVKADLETKLSAPSANSEYLNNVDADNVVCEEIESKPNEGEFGVLANKEEDVNSVSSLDTGEDNEENKESEVKVEVENINPSSLDPTKNDDVNCTSCVQSFDIAHLSEISSVLPENRPEQVKPVKESELCSPEVQGDQNTDSGVDGLDQFHHNVTSLSVEWNTSQFPATTRFNNEDENLSNLTHKLTLQSGAQGEGSKQFISSNKLGQESLAYNKSARRVRSGDGELSRFDGEAGETSLPLDFGDSLSPILSGLVDKQFRMCRLVKEAGMELGVLITKKYNKDKKTTGYIIAYIEPNGLVYRLVSSIYLYIYFACLFFRSYPIKIKTAQMRQFEKKIRQNLKLIQNVDFQSNC